MDKEIVITGHGLAGCVLAMTCYRREIPFRIIGHPQTGEASMASSGLIAPITGRRYVKAWRVDEFVPKALDFYRWSESLLGETFFYPIEIVRFLMHPESKKAWYKRLDDPEYSQYISVRHYPELEVFQKPYGILTGGFRLDTPKWVRAVRHFLQEKKLLEFTESPFVIPKKNHSHWVTATGAIDSSLMPKIIPNKGESLIVHMPEWRIQQVVKEEVYIVPLVEKSMFWIGSDYAPWPDHPDPTEEAKRRMLESIRKVYNGPLEVQEHLAGIRPTVNDRRPLIGRFPGKEDAYIFNGMGTKGTSLAPFWADELLSLILQGKALSEEVDPARWIHRPDFGKPENV